MPRDFARQIRRRNLRSRALTGRGMSTEQLESVTRANIGAQLDVGLREQVTAENIRRSREASELERERLKQEGKAATISGVVGVGGLGIGAAQSKTVQSLAGKVADTRVGQAAKGAASRIAEQVGLGASTPSTVGATSQFAAAPSTAIPGASTAPTAPSVLGKAGQAAGAGVAGYLGAKIGQSIFTGGKKGGPTQTLVGGVSGAATGALYGTYIMPGLGTLIGGAIGAVGGFLSDLF